MAIAIAAFNVNCCWHYSNREMPRIPRAENGFSLMPSLRRGCNILLKNNKGIQVISPEISSPSFKLDQFLDAWDDEYGGIIIDPNNLPSSVNAFASALRASLSNWKLKAKMVIQLCSKHSDSSDPIGHTRIYLKDKHYLLVWENTQNSRGVNAGKEGNMAKTTVGTSSLYSNSSTGYVMLTYWIPEEPCLLPASPSHQIGVGGFVINDKREVLVVKEKCPCSCSGVWKMPTGYINKFEDIFSGVTREVKEETGVDTIFLKLVAFRHAHRVAFDKSDILFVCMLKPLSYEITVDEKELQAAKWMALDDYKEQPFYEEDHMSRRVIDACIAAYDDHYNGFVAHQLTSKLDGKLSYLYYDSSSAF